MQYGTVLTVNATKALSSIKENAQLWPFQSQSVQPTVSLTEFSALAMMDIIKFLRELAVNVQMERFGMETCADGHQFVNLDMHLTMPLGNAKLLE